MISCACPLNTFTFFNVHLIKYVERSTTEHNTNETNETEQNETKGHGMDQNAAEHNETKEKKLTRIKRRIYSAC